MQNPINPNVPIIGKKKCPICSKLLVIRTEEGKEEIRPGNIAICHNCVEMLVLMPDGNFRPMFAGEYLTLPSEMKVKLTELFISLQAVKIQLAIKLPPIPPN